MEYEKNFDNVTFKLLDALRNSFEQSWKMI